MTDPEPKAGPPPKGLYCPECRGVRLMKLYVKYPCPGVKIHYWLCTACDNRVKSREVIVTSFRSKKKGTSEVKPKAGELGSRKGKPP